MEINFNEESFKEAIKQCKIIRWENYFKEVVKSYLIQENKISNEVRLRDTLKDFLEYVEETIDYLPCEASVLIDDYIKSI